MIISLSDIELKKLKIFGSYIIYGAEYVPRVGERIHFEAENGNGLELKVVDVIYSMKGRVSELSLKPTAEELEPRQVIAKIISKAKS